MPELEIHYHSEWAALYVDGRLDTTSVGDSYVAEERALELCGVKVVTGSDFLMGGNQRKHAAQTLQELARYNARVEAKQRAADALKEQAARLLEEAALIEAADP